MDISVSTIVEALGGEGLIKHPIRHELDLMTVVEAGLPIESLTHLQGRFGFTNKVMSQILAVSESTYQRRIRANDRLTKDETEKVIALSEVYEKGIEVFENQADLTDWLTSPIYSLLNKRPVDLLDTILGRRQVMRVLNAILHGIYL